MKKRIIWLALTLLFAAAALAGAVRVRSLLREYARGEEVYSSLRRCAGLSPDGAGPGAVKPPGGAGPEVDFPALREINPDIVGWIHIEGTEISYPIVQGEDNERYLGRLFTGEENRAGCLFLNCGNAPDFSDRNSVVYGHSLRDGSMFTQLLEYKDQAFFDAHPAGWLVTPEKRFRIRFFSGFVSGADGEAWEVGFPSEGDFARWLEEAAGKSAFTGGPAPTAADRVLTLSTCSYESSDARFVLMGLLDQPP